MGKQRIDKKTIRESIVKGLRAKLNEMYYGQTEQTPEMVKREFDKIPYPAFDMSEEDGGVVYIQYDVRFNKLLGCYATNVGMRPRFEMDFELDHTLQENLEMFYEIIYNELHEEKWESVIRKGVVNAVCEAVMSDILKKKIVNENEENDELTFGDLSDLLMNMKWDIINSSDGKYKGQPAMRVEVAPNGKATPTDQMINAVQEYVGNKGTVISSVGQNVSAPEIKRQSFIIVWK